MALTFISANNYANQISNETIQNGSYWRISNLWHKGDYSLLYAEDRKEATAAAFAMAANVSPGLAKTLFVSFPQNLRDIQPQLRGNENVQIFIPTANLETDFSEELIDNLRTAIKDHGFDTIVIDNLNRISALSTGRNAALTQLVNSLFALHVETDATLLITAYNLSKSTRFRLAALTDTTFSAETVQEEGIYRTQKSCILTNALRPDNLASQNNLINDDSRGGWELHSNHRPMQLVGEDGNPPDNANVASLLGHDLRSKAAGGKTSRQHQQCEFQVSCSNNSTNNNPSDSQQSKLVGTRIFASAPADTSASSNNNASDLSEPSDSSDSKPTSRNQNQCESQVPCSNNTPPLYLDYGDKTKAGLQKIINDPSSSRAERRRALKTYRKLYDTTS